MWIIRWNWQINGHKVLNTLRSVVITKNLQVLSLKFDLFLFSMCKQLPPVDFKLWSLCIWKRIKWSDLCRDWRWCPKQAIRSWWLEFIKISILYFNKLTFPKRSLALFHHVARQKNAGNKSLEKFLQMSVNRSINCTYCGRSQCTFGSPTFIRSVGLQVIGCGTWFIWFC